MPRSTNSKVTRARHNKFLKLAKGYFGSKHTLFRTAHEQVMRSLRYQFRDRKQRKRNFRKLWITRINAACRSNGISYSLFITGLKREKIELNRKVLSELAISDPNTFKELVATAKKGLRKALPEQFGQNEKGLPQYLNPGDFKESKKAKGTEKPVAKVAVKKPAAVKKDAKTTESKTTVKKEVKPASEKPKTTPKKETKPTSEKLKFAPKKEVKPTSEKKSAAKTTTVKKDTTKVSK